jgi:hypothetical protein
VVEDTCRFIICCNSLVEYLRNTVTYTCKPIIHNFYRCPLRCSLLQYATKGLLSFHINNAINTWTSYTDTTRRAFAYKSECVIYRQCDVTSSTNRPDAGYCLSCRRQMRIMRAAGALSYLKTWLDVTYLWREKWQKIASWYTYICERETKWGCKGGGRREKENW